MSQRRLSLVLDLDSGTFSAKMRSASRETELFQRRVQTTDATLRRLDRGVNGSTAKLRDFVLVMGNLREAIENTRFFFTGLIEAAVGATAEIERTVYLLRGLSSATTEFGRRREAQENLEGLIETAKKAPFSINALSDTFVKFKAGGLDPTNGSMQSLLDAVAAFGGSDEVLKRAAVAIQQMGGKGVISMEELRQQLGEAVPTAINLMAKGLGKSYQDLVKEISLGKTRAAPALKAMFEQFQIAFGGKAEAMMDTFNGRVAQLKTSLVELAMAFTGMDTSGNVAAGSFYDILKSAISDITETISSDGFRTTMNELGSSIGIMATTITSMGGAIGQVAGYIPILNSLQNVIIGIAAVAIAKLGGAAGGAVSAFVTKTRDGIMGTIRARQEETNSIQRNSREAVFAANIERDNNRMSIIGTREKIAENERQAASLRTLIALDNQRLAQANRMLASGRTSTGQFASAAALAQADARRKAAINDIANASRRLNEVTAQGNALAAQSTALHAAAGPIDSRRVAALGAQATALRLNNTLMLAGTLAARGLGAALAFFGGPIGIAIMAVAAAFTYFSNEAREAEAAGRNAANIIDEIKGAAEETKPSLDILVTGIRDQTSASGDAATAARDNATAYDALGQAAANAAEYVKYLTAAQRQQKLQEVRDAKDKLQSSLTGNGPLTGMFTTNEQERVANLRARYIRLNGGDARADRYSRNSEAAQQAASRAMAAPENSERRRAYQEYRLAAEAFNENGRRLGALAATEREILDAAGAPTLERPTPAATPTTPTGTPDSNSSGGGRNGRGGSSRSPTEVTQGQVDSLLERVAGINAELAGAGKEAGKVAYALDHDPVLRAASAEVRQNLRDAAAALDEANSKMEGMRAFEALTDEAKQQEESVTRLNAEIDQISNGMSDAVRQNAAYRAGLTENVTTAKQFTTEAEAMADRAANAQRQFQTLSKQRDAMLELERAVQATGIAAGDAWAEFAGGAMESDRELLRYRRSLSLLLANIPEGTKQWTAMKAAMDAAVNNFKIEQATRALIDMRQETAKIMAETSGFGSARAQSVLQVEADQYWRVLEAAQLTTAQRQQAEDEYYRWKAAKEREIAFASPIAQMAQEWGDLWGNMQQASTQWSGQFVDDLIDGKKSFSEFTTSILKDIAKMLVKALIARAVLAAIGMMSPGAGAGTFTAPTLNLPTLTLGQGPVMPAGVAHTGGIAGSSRLATRSVPAHLFNNAPKFHGGGIIGKDERAAILQKKEGVFTEEQMKSLAPVGSGTGAMPSVQVNVINESGQEMSAQQGTTRFDGKSFILDVVIDAASRPGKMRDALKGVSAR